MTQMFPIASMSDDSQTSRVQFLNTCALEPLPVSVCILLNEIPSIEKIIMLKRFCTLFAHNIRKNSLLSVPIVSSIIEHSCVLTTPQLCLFRCSCVRILPDAWFMRVCTIYSLHRNLIQTNRDGHDI